MLAKLLLRLSEAEHPVLWGRVAAPHFGREFDRLLGQGVLVEERPAETWEVCGACECGLDTRPIREIGGRNVAVCPLDRRADVHLSDDDIRSFHVDPTLLAGLIGTASGLGSTPEIVLPGVWRLGTLSGTQAIFLALSVSAATQPALMGMLIKAARGAASTLLAPTGMPAESRRLLDDAGIHVVAVLDAVGDDSGAPFALRPGVLVPTIAPKLLLDRARLAVSLLGIEGTLAKQSFDLLWILAEAGGAVVEHRTILARLWSQPRAKAAVNDAVRDLREGLVKIAPRGESLVETKMGQGYRLALDPGEIAFS
jgi:hypothetical protein